MATHILDAFIITFGLDKRGYDREEREFRKGLKDTRENAKKTFDEVEGGGKKVSQSFRNMRNEVVGLVLAFAGANSITSFAGNLLGTEAAAARLAETLGISASKLIAWQESTKQLGGTAGEADAALITINKAIQGYKLLGTTGADADYRGLGVTNSDLMSKDPSEILLKIAAAGEKLSKPEFAARLARIGLPQSTIYMLEQGRSKLQAQIVEAEKLANVTDKSTKAAQEFERQLALLQTKIAGALRPSVTEMIKVFIEFLDQVQNGTTELPSLNDTLVVIGVTAAVIGAPLVALAAAIALVVANLQSLKKVWKEFTDFYNSLSSGADKFMDPIRRALGLKTGEEARRDGTDVFGQSASGAGAAGGGGGSGNWITRQQQSVDRAVSGVGSASGGSSGIVDYLKRAGFTDQQALGIAAGIHAESGSNPNAVNSKSGAFGIGQWLGPRKQALMRRYGPNPNMDQQLAFLVSELRGGDKGGPAVGRTATADHALLTYIVKFMRPRAGAETLGDIRRGRAFLSRNGGGSGVTVGAINVYPRSGDPKAIGVAVREEIMRRAFIPQVDAGVNP